MAVKYPENFLTYGPRTLESGELENEIRDLEASLENTSGNVAICGYEARMKALALMKMLRQAEADYDMQNYAGALEGFEAIAKKILALIQPEIEEFELPSDWPTGSDMESTTDAIAAEMLSQMTPERQEAAPIVAEDVELPYPHLGRAEKRKPWVKYQPEEDDRVQDLVEQGIRAARQGRWNQAANYFETAREEATGEKQVADLFLNVGAMLLQSGDARRAEAYLDEARNMYRDLGDDLGAAQATHNMGLARLYLKDGGGALQRLNEAKDLAQQADLIGYLDPEENDLDFESPSAPLASRINITGEAAQNSGSQNSGANTVAGAFMEPQTLDSRFEVAEEVLAIGPEDQQLRLSPVISNLSNPDVDLQTPALEIREDVDRMLVMSTGGTTVELEWDSGEILPAQELRDALAPRVQAESLEDLEINFETPAGVLAHLSLLYHLVLPIKMADCHHELADFEKAEAEYLRAADYELINLKLEAADLWRRLAKNIMVWGDQLYREGDPDAAETVYMKLMTEDAAPGDSYLYTHSVLGSVGSDVEDWLAAYSQGGDLPELNPAITSHLFDAIQRWEFLKLSLDFFGVDEDTLPPFTFRYLQEVARYFAERAIQAEQRYIDFQTRFEDQDLTRQQLENAAKEAEANAEAARRREEAAEESFKAASASVDLAELRHDNVQELYDEVTSAAQELRVLDGWIAAANVFNPEDETSYDLTYRYVDGEKVTYEGTRHEVLQDMTERRTEISNQLQETRLENNIAEANQAIQEAEARRDVSEAQSAAAEAERQAAEMQAEHAQEMLDAFEDTEFPPELWAKMANLMKELAQTALDRAIEIAQMMQLAYNFENLESRHVIQNDYNFWFLDGLLGGEILLRDIDSFTYDLIRGVKDKPIPVKWSLSLAEDYPAQLLALQSEGRTEFDVDLDRVRLAHPGTYRHQLKGVEVIAEGFLPPFGLRGRLTNAGIGTYRKEDGETKKRVQPAETMILSQYEVRNDSLILTPPEEMRALFEDNGLVSGWTLEFPPSANDVNLSAIFDVRLVLYFECLFSQDLFDEDTNFQDNELHERSRGFLLRQHFPDAFFQLREAGVAELGLTEGDFPHHQLDPELQSLALAVSSEDESFEGAELIVEHPGASDPVTVTFDEDDAILSENLPVEDGSSALGDYTFELGSGDVDLKDEIDDLVLLMEYEFTPRS